MDGPGLVLAPGPEGWWDSSATSAPQVLLDDDGWKMWYYGRDPAFDPEISGPHARTGLAVSPDGIHWERVRGPLTLGSVLEPDPDRTRFDSGQVGVTCVQKRDGIYWMWYLGGDQDWHQWGDQRRKSIPYQIGCAISRDGVHWTRLAGPDRGALLLLGAPGEFDELSATFGRVVRTPSGEWRLYYHGLHPTRGGRIGLAVSEDGLRWEKHGQILENGESGRFDERGVTCRSVISADGGYLMFYEASDHRGYYGIGLATSPDGLTWTKEYSDRPDGAIFAPSPSGSGRWDSRVVGTPCVVPLDDGSYRLYYVGGNEPTPEQPAFRQAIGLAVSDGPDFRSWRRWDE